MIAVETKARKLVFIYNADSGLFNAALDSLHKAFLPQTYSCSLCLLTHDTFTRKEAWASFIDQSDFIAEFYHKDEIRLDEGVELPVILEHDKVLCSAEELNKLSNIDELIDLIKEKISRLSS